MLGFLYCLTAPGIFNVLKKLLTFVFFGISFSKIENILISFFALVDKLTLSNHSCNVSLVSVL